MQSDRINADFAQRVVLDTDSLNWIASPQPGVERRMPDRIGGEVARATSLVRYAPNSHFPPHVHELGEEFLVLDGVFSDESGDYPKGTYVRNPPGSRHTPFTDPGCIILVKLRQMHAGQNQHVAIDTTRAVWRDGSVKGQSTLTLYDDPHIEFVELVRLSPGVRLAPREVQGGEEIFVLEGSLQDAHGSYGPRSWIRNPAGFRYELGTAGGALFWTKRVRGFS